MPSYSAVSQVDLLKSINDALDLLAGNSSGPLCQKEIAGLRTPDPATGLSPLDAVAAATTNKDLAAAASRVGGVLQLLQPLLVYHGLNDTGGKGRDVYGALISWGGIRGANSLEFTQRDREMHVYLAVQYARKLAKGTPVAQGLKNTFWSVASAGPHGVVLAHSLNKLVRHARRGASDAELKAVLADLNPNDLLQVREAGSFACGFHKTQKNGLPTETNWHLYCLVIPDAEKLTYKSPEVVPRNLKVYDILDPFNDAHEAENEGFGYLHQKQNANKPPLGIVFFGSSRAASAVAAAFPDMEVLDEEENRVPPASKNPVPLPAKTGNSCCRQ